MRTHAILTFGLLLAVPAVCQDPPKLPAQASADSLTGQQLPLVTLTSAKLSVRNGRKPRDNQRDSCASRSLTALAFVLIIGEPERFGRGKQIAAYLGLVPEEESSGESRRLGHISKQGSGLMRFFLVEAAQITVRSDAEWRNKFFPSSHATRTEDPQSRHGAPTGGSSVPDVAQAMGL